ncbi:MAG: DUF4492 domain-containing protein [Paramuribaculum sp.]|nr:DUF4492 domain-containing protein [Paramuribaculum sp.]MDE5723027.1 DUF4492 domain-containing protein [Paramuribaculum sp.]MDE5920253.1 DUF4492 domain-containing protein [Paramuribaculum sp.]
MTKRPDNNGQRRPHTLAYRVADLYIDGFRSMTVGRSLWVIILIKLAILFLVFKLFFFPDLLSRDYPTDEDRAAAVRNELIDRSSTSDSK